MSSAGLSVFLLVLAAPESGRAKTIARPIADAGGVGAEQVAEHQPLRVRQQQHQGDRGEQGRVEHRQQREQEDLDQVAHPRPFSP